MKISVICNDGSPLGVSEQSIYGEDGRMGIGGAELALLTLCRGWHDAGHRVTLYNDGDNEGSVFEHRGIDEYRPGNPCDVLIVFRSPNTRIRDGARGLKVWFSTDQHTMGNFQSFAGMVDKIVTISPHHSEYFQNMYGIFDTIIIDLPVRTQDFEPIEVWPEKVQYKCIWNSIPDRGVIELAEVWKRINKKMPEASLVITSDWRLWDKNVHASLLDPYRAVFAALHNVNYLGAINRRELIKHEKEAQIHLNPNIYEELFCIAIAETQVAGAYPVSSTTGALKTTNMGMALEGNPKDGAWHEKCANAVVELLQDQKRLARLANAVQHKAVHRFALENVLKQWEERVFANG